MSTEKRFKKEKEILLEFENQARGKWSIFTGWLNFKKLDEVSRCLIKRLSMTGRPMRGQCSRWTLPPDRTSTAVLGIASVNKQNYRLTLFYLCWFNRDNQFTLFWHPPSPFSWGFKVNNLNWKFQCEKKTQKWVCHFLKL